MEDQRGSLQDRFQAMIVHLIIISDYIDNDDDDQKQMGESVVQASYTL